MKTKALVLLIAGMNSTGRDGVEEQSILILGPIALRRLLLKRD
jgi:hypothetical protein